MNIEIIGQDREVVEAVEKKFIYQDEEKIIHSYKFGIKITFQHSIITNTSRYKIHIPRGNNQDIVINCINEKQACKIAETLEPLTILVLPSL